MPDDNDQYVPTITDSDLSQIATLAQAYIEIHNQVNRLEHELERTKEMFKQISTVKLPEAMNNINMREFTLRNGYKLKVREIFNVRIPKGRINQADDWLNEHGHTGMIKHKLEVALPKDLTAAQLDSIDKFLKQQRYQYDIVKDVHWATIQAWAKEVNEAGEVIPEDIFSIFRGHETIISE